MSNDKTNNYSLIPEQFQGQFISLDWNSVCPITQSKRTGETIHQIPERVCVRVCMPLHSFGLSTLERSPAGEPEPIGVSKKDQRALVTQRVSSQLLKENHLL